ncbi:TIGR01620 family protein [Pseudochrobactrum algeriensis]|uniref:YcjF family protein n=1 Tax=Pseudochrobactrum algeriensis TaxID=2834768 RepID=UPI001BCE8CFF|nr:TIGR01620 family protein [Pseudochrobactrum algeriensis]MBX8811034.1 TIGR01620 family protein [Ochrobactrum sp. MR34]QVQ35583.1 TIGR01620 family protein [Pseudochrobactrum algeriensis]QVQ38804.1 TIGR01620 family protein [Pseudochrobactrum algeriensis]QVQ42716.1 TIGR01620 family protein [Pseudochrobactrum algeriensis]
MSEKPRKPTSFSVDLQADNSQPQVPRKPVAIRDLSAVTAEPVDVFEQEAIDAGAQLTPPPASLLKRRFTLRSVFFTALGLLLSFAVGIWTEDLIRAMFSRADWLGWLTFGVALIALASLIALVVREGLALRRLSAVQELRFAAAEATERNDAEKARKVTDRLLEVAACLPQTARGRTTLEALRGDIIDGRDLIRITEREILHPLDREARMLILNAAKRVSIVTAVSPRALVDIAYVIFESSRLIRRLSELYGCRPGSLGFLRLARSVIAHLAITGTIAMGDSVVQQLLGQGLASRLSAKLGEGVINGMMTARIGISAMDIVRPLPFDAEKRPNISDFVSDIVKATTQKKPL